MSVSLRDPNTLSQSRILKLLPNYDYSLQNTRATSSKEILQRTVQIAARTGFNPQVRSLLFPPSLQDLLLQNHQQETNSKRDVVTQAALKGLPETVKRLLVTDESSSTAETSSTIHKKRPGDKKLLPVHLHSLGERPQAALLEKFAQASLGCMQRMSLDSLQRLKEIATIMDTGYITPGSIARLQSLVGNGVYYSNEYALMIKKMSTELFNTMNRLGNFYHGISPTDYFISINDSTCPFGKFPNVYMKVEGVRASNALKALIQGPTFIDCATACQISFFSALLDVLGTEKFDVLFGDKSPCRLCIGDCITTGPDYFLCTDTLNPPKGTKITKGARVFFQGPPLYSNKHPFGEDTGWNVRCTNTTPGEEEFIGFGLGEGKPVKFPQIAEDLVHRYNKPPIHYEIFDPQTVVKILIRKKQVTLKDCNALKDHQTNLKEYTSDLANKKVLVVTRQINPRRLELLVKSSIPDAFALIKKWSKEHEFHAQTYSTFGRRPLKTR